MDTSSKLSDIHNTESNSSNKSTNESSTLDFIPEIENTETDQSTSQTENTETGQSISKTENTETGQSISQTESKTKPDKNYICHPKELDIVKQMFYNNPKKTEIVTNPDKTENVTNPETLKKWMSEATGIKEPEELGDFY